MNELQPLDTILSSVLLYLTNNYKEVIEIEKNHSRILSSIFSR